MPYPLRLLGPVCLLVAGVLVCLPVAAAIPAGFDAQFSVDRSGMPLGTTRFTLSRGDKSGCWVYRGQANPNMLVRMFLGNVTDESQFCMVNGTVRPQRFKHHIDGKPKKSYTLVFDWSTMQATYDSEAGKHRVYKLVDGAQDPLSLQIAARRWVAASAQPAKLGEKTFQMIDDDGVSPYRLGVSNGGTIDTRGGRYDTLKVARVGKHSHALAFWLAKSADWIPVQVRQLKDGNAAFTMKLDALKR
ncbi:MAG: DUF3108 domain-containing protein [Salinisphaera sp.]|jgi:hypothetical protein|nr:DUF3108 domain-containing protein [Salinisphaera sp.]